jgi:uncharacterized protein (TIGR00369 family)
MRRPVVFGDDPGRCFGCGSANPAGLHLAFVETDEGVEAEYAVPSHLEGAPGIVHGGIQGTLLDEVFCVTAFVKQGTFVVTGELTVRYLRPTPTDTPLVVRGRIVEARERSFGIEGGIHLAATGEELTRGRGRFFAAPRP